MPPKHSGSSSAADLHVFAPTTVEAFVRWGGLEGPLRAGSVRRHRRLLATVRTPLGDAFALAEDAPMLRQPPLPTDVARLLPSGDPYYLLWRADREFLVPDAAQRAELWTSRSLARSATRQRRNRGTWRRSKAEVAVAPWRRSRFRNAKPSRPKPRALPLTEVKRQPSTSGRGRAALARWRQRRGRLRLMTESRVNASSASRRSSSSSTWCSYSRSRRSRASSPTTRRGKACCRVCSSSARSGGRGPPTPGSRTPSTRRRASCGSPSSPRWRRC